MNRGTSGRGPMSVMSPFSTLNSCGNSSSLVARSRAPSLVTRESERLGARGPAAVGAGDNRAEFERGKLLARPAGAALPVEGGPPAGQTDQAGQQHDDRAGDGQ